MQWPYAKPAAPSLKRKNKKWTVQATGEFAIVDRNLRQRHYALVPYRMLDTMLNVYINTRYGCLDWVFAKRQ